MAYKPLTQEQYQAAIKAGFKPEQIIANEKIRQQKENSIATFPTSESFPKEVPAEVKQGFFAKLDNVAKGVGNALTTSEQTLGQGLSTVFDSNSQNTVNQIQQQKDDSATMMINAIKKEVDPIKKQHLVSIFKELYPADAKSLTAEDLNPAFGLSNKQVVGAALGTALDIASVGSYGQAAKGAQTGKLLTSAPTGIIANTLGKAGIESTAKPILSIAEQQVAKAAGRTVAGVAKKALVGGALGYGYDVSQNLQNNDTKAYKPGFGTTIGAGLPIVSAVGGAIYRNLTGLNTGAGKDIITRAIDNPDEVNNAIKKYAKTPEAQQSLVDSAKESLNSYLQQRNKQYGEAVSGLVAKEPISKQTVIDSFAKSLGNFGGDVKDGAIVFRDTALNSAEQKSVKDVFSVVKKWKDVTPQGLDTLRQRIGNEMTNFKFANNGRDSVILGAVKQNLTKELSSKISGYADLLKSYGEQSATAKNLAAELSLKGTAKPATQLKQVMKIFKKDPSVLENLNKVMGEKEASQFLNEISGAVLSNWLPQSGLMANSAKLGLEGAGIAAAGLLHANPIGIGTIAGVAATASPKIVGKTAVVAGKLINKGTGKIARRLLPKVASKLNSSQ